MKKLLLLALLVVVSGCASFKPVQVKSYRNFTPSDGECTVDTSDNSSNKQTAQKTAKVEPKNEIGRARLYASCVADTYKATILKDYDLNDEFNLGILNVVTLGVGAGVAELHTDVIKTAAMALGYQTASKTYSDIPYKLEIYTNALVAAQCVYDNSYFLEQSYDDLTKLKTIRSILMVELEKLKRDETVTQNAITNYDPSLGQASTVIAKLERGLALAIQAEDALETGSQVVAQAVQKIDITVLKRFNGKLPDIDEITAQLRAQVKENIELEQEGGVPELPDGQVAQMKGIVHAPGTPYSALAKPLAAAIKALNDLSNLRVERYIAEVNLVKACPASI